MMLIIVLHDYMSNAFTPLLNAAVKYTAIAELDSLLF